MLPLRAAAPSRHPLVARRLAGATAVLGVALILLFAAAEACAAVRFVAQDATGAGNGTSWADAFLHPQDAVAVSTRGDEVWVKEARYVRKHNALQVLALKNGVAVYGGFAGDERALAERDPALHETILDGEHEVEHVVTTPGGGRLDGFTVTGGGPAALTTAEGGGFFGDRATLARLVFFDNRAFYGGAASGEDLVVEDSTFDANYALAGGGALFLEGDSFVRRSSFVGNEAEEDQLFWPGGGSGVGHGGAIYAGIGAFEIEDSSFDANVAYGGGALVVSGLASSTTAQVRRSTFTGNRSSAVVAGGFLAFTVEDSTFTANAALVRQLTTCDPFGSCDTVTFPAKGGGLVAGNNPVTVRRSVFSANTSQNYGGAVYTGAAGTTIEDSRFEDNTAVHGGGLLLDRAPHFVSDTVFLRNQAITGGGGAAALYPVEPSVAPTSGTFERCRFEENLGSVGGGALALFDGDTLVESSRFFGNQALLGGGVAASSVTPGIEARLEMRNSLLAFNQASDDGGGLALIRITAEILNDTFYGNDALGRGGGLWLDSRPDVTVTNTILWNDTARSGPEIALGSGVLPENFSVAFSDVKGGWPGTGNLNADPGLRDPFLLDFHLTWPGSQAVVDSGTPGFSPVYDFEGELRPIDGNLDGEARVDIGADELSNPCAGQLDRDADGVCDPLDNCLAVPNAGQQDSGGIGLGSPPDGIGDACQCGDVNGDGFVTLTDAVSITRSLLVPPTAQLPQPDLCDVGGSDGCSIADAVIIRRALLVPPTATVQPVCEPGPP